MISWVASRLNPEENKRHHNSVSTNAAPHRTDDDGPCSDLYDLVLEMRWHSALKHVALRPQDASWQDGDTLETALHLTCQNRPPVRLVKALLNAYPEAATTKSYKAGYLPLHLACRYNASIEVLRELLSNHPQTAAWENKFSTTPLHSLLEGRDTIANTETENYRTLFWQKVELLLRTIAMTRGDEMFVLHAAVSIGSLRCPEPIIDFCLDQHARLVHRRDSTGRLPLHLAVGPAPYSESSRRRYKPRELHVLHRLLELHPEGARQHDPNEVPDRMPLHTALVNGHVWYGGVKELFEAAPEVAALPDPVTKLFPYQLSQDVDTVFKLLRSLPCVVGRGGGNGWSAIDGSIADFRALRRRSSTPGTECQPNLHLGDDNDDGDGDSRWTNHCFMGVFVVGAAAGLICRFLPFLNNEHQPPLFLEVDRQAIT